MDIRAAFLQSKELDREVFVVPPRDVAKDGVIWKLRKPLYGLDDASRKFWMKIKPLFHEEGMKTLSGDEAFYYQHDGKNLNGMILTQVDDFFMAGKSDFLMKITKKIEDNLTVEKDKFRFNGIDVIRTSNGIEISMNDYANSIEEIQDIRKAKKDEVLTKTEMKLYRKMTGKLNWLADNTRPDLSISALLMSKKNSQATIGDLKRVNHIVKQIKSKENKVVFSKIGRKEDFIIHGLGDASYRCDDKSNGGNVHVFKYLFQ